MEGDGWDWLSDGGLSERYMGVMKDNLKLSVGLDGQKLNI